MAKEAQVKNAVKTIEALEAEKLEAQKAAQAATLAYIAALRPATNEELKAVQDAVRNETEYPKGYNVSFKLTDEQKVTLKEFKKARRDELKDKKVRAKYTRMAGKMTLVSARYRETARKNKDGKAMKPKRTLSLRYSG
jgi:hypothetical protein